MTCHHPNCSAMALVERDDACYLTCMWLSLAKDKAITEYIHLVIVVYG